jgi:hypothetical protein
MGKRARSDVKRVTLPETCKIDVCVTAVASVRAIVLAFDGLGVPIIQRSANTARCMAHKRLYEFAHLDTPYGIICQSSSVNGKLDATSVFHVNPVAFLYAAAKQSAFFFDFLVSISVANRWKVCVYLDKATPGNNQRFDDGRTCQCLYWTFLDFPRWYLSRDLGWMPFAYVLETSRKTAGLTDAQLVSFFALQFEGFKRGCCIESPTGAHHALHADVDICIADWEQHVRNYNLKGPSGRLACGWCRNAMWRMPWFTHDYLVHLKSDEWDRFDKHTVETFREVADEIKRVATTGSPEELDTLQTNTGLKWDPDGIMWNDQMQGILVAPYASYMDWQHTVVGSGSVAQLELNGMLRVLISKNIPLTSVDDWTRNICLPKSLEKLRKGFFRSRYAKRDGAHFRCFASECITAVMMLGLFLDVVVAPLDLGLEVHLQCFTLLRIMITLLQDGNFSSLPCFEQAARTHHTLFNHVYWNLSKNKLHGIMHIVDAWKRWEKLLSCFGPERHHKIMKRALGFCYNRCDKSSLAYDVRRFMTKIHDASALQQFHVGGNIIEKPFNVPMRGGHISITSYSAEVVAVRGRMLKRDLLQWNDAANVASVGFAVGFGTTSHAECVAFIRTCVRRSASSWVDDPSSPIAVIDVRRLEGAVPYILDGRLIVPSLYSSVY